jgi:spore maturation protein CgeB
MLLPLSPFIQRGAARIDTETCVKIFNASAINLNLHSSTHHEGVDPAGDFVNPRTFEIASCSSFQLVDRRSLMFDLFAEDELETFSCMADLRGKIDHFLSNPEARVTIAEKGRRRILAEHSYLSRMEEMLTLMMCEFPIISEKQLHRLERQEAFQTEMAQQDNLLEILAKIRPAGAVRLTDIYQSIEEIQGELSRAEKIFLMLKNIEVQVGVNS